MILWRAMLRSVTASQEEIANDEERRAASTHQGCCAVQALEGRRRARVSGVLRSVVLRPRGGALTVEAELFDGTGSLDLVWLGRRQIAGVEPGRRIVVEGLVCDLSGRRRMYNPKYELLAR